MGIFLGFHLFQHLEKFTSRSPSPMGTRRIAPLLLAVVVASACNEQEQPDGVTGPQFKPAPPPSASACSPNSLNNLITGYFPGTYASAIKSLKDAMIAATTGSSKRDKGFEILDSIGSVSRNPAYSLDPVAGSELTKGIIKCMFDAGDFSPSFPSNAIYDFAPALSHASGGAYYVRGGTSGGTATVVGALIAPGTENTVLSGVARPPGSPQPTWTTMLAGNTGSEGRVLIYGYPVMLNPALVYEWATIPPAAEFSPGAIVAVCDDNTAPTTMVHETNVGILQYSSGDPICNAPISLVLRETGWGARALAARLARVLAPSTLHAAVVAKSGSGGTVTTVKSQFSTGPVETVTLKFTQPPEKVLKLGQSYSVEVRATTVFKGAVTGVNGACIYLIGSENNGVLSELTGTRDASCQNVPKAVFDRTESKVVAGQPSAGYAVFEVTATKNGGLAITASASDDSGATGVLGRDGQTFVIDQVKVNVKP
jgi:hypothetical protein